jgi:hypothetical protein
VQKLVNLLSTKEACQKVDGHDRRLAVKLLRLNLNNWYGASLGGSL